MKRSDVTPELNAAAFDFLFWFARFEYALKKNGYLKSTDTGKKAEPNWDMFVKRNRNKYAPATAALALVKARPRQQVVTANAHLGWQELQFAETEFELQKVTLLLRLLRNHLFQGGKPADGHWDDPGKLIPLLEIGRAALDELAAAAGLKADYERA